MLNSNIQNIEYSTVDGHLGVNFEKSVTTYLGRFTIHGVYGVTVSTGTQLDDAIFSTNLQVHLFTIFDRVDSVSNGVY